ncbi:hypothetical protein GSY69_09205 [Brevibacterium sp. 5221]|uniref:Uncharacterized protein n=1 Tax=Brevibacterium rongguiense TaxID=2695267 RepID=A0A6N9H840_9MICO|nr:hypothetical protein [Brevibacterium rongguiense]MYM20139.1 hypothetical protein [Brevibacterium rongguiense]
MSPPRAAGPWMAFGYEPVAALPPDLAAAWPPEFRPPARDRVAADRGCAPGAAGAQPAPGAAGAGAETGELREALAEWVRTAAAVFAAAHAHLLLRISCDRLRLLAQAAVVGSTAVVVLRGWSDGRSADGPGPTAPEHPRPTTPEHPAPAAPERPGSAVPGAAGPLAAGAVSPEPAALFGAGVPAPHLPGLLAELIPDGAARTVTGTVLPTSALAPSAAYAAAPLVFHDCAACPHPELVPPGVDALALHFPGPRLRAAVRSTLADELLRAAVWSWS